MGALHEIAGGANGAVDASASAALAAGIAARTGGKVLWCHYSDDLAKLEVTTRAEAVHVGLTYGIIQPQPRVAKVDFI